MTFNANKNIPIVLCADDNYFPYVAIVIQSVMENADRNKNFNIYILYRSISTEYKNILTQQIHLFPNFSIDFINVSPYFENYKFDNLKYTEAAYYRLMIPYLFTEYDKVIYLDCDVICLANIAELLEESSDNHILSCVRDSGVISWEKDYARSLGLQDPLNYFNTGVLVFNTALFRQHIPKESLLKAAASKNWAYADQCLMNAICEEKIYFLPMKWNVMSDNALKDVPKSLKKEHNAAKKEPKIIHYVWDKPWKHFFISDRNKYFWFYAKKTPFADIVFSRLKQIELKKPDNTPSMIYDKIAKDKRFNFRFIVKCIFLWAKRTALSKD